MTIHGIEFEEDNNVIFIFDNKDNVGLTLTNKGRIELKKIIQNGQSSFIQINDELTINLDKVYLIFYKTENRQKGDKK
jgi:hypothetical protein